MEEKKSKKKEKQKVESAFINSNHQTNAYTLYIWVWYDTEFIFLEGRNLLFR